MDKLFNNIEGYTNLISELNAVIAKHTQINADLKCLVMVKNKSESMAVFNTKETEVKEFLSDLASSFSSTTATTTSDYHTAV